MNDFLQAFLIFDVFLAGMVATVALRHGLAHFRPGSHDLDKNHAPQGGHLPPAVRQKLMEEAQANFESVVRAAAHDLQRDLAATSEEIKKQIETLSKDTTGQEIEHYKAVAAELQKQVKTDEEDLDKEVATQKADLKVKLAQEMAAEKQKLMEQIDTKLADAVTSFLMETLQHDVDLGAQAAYLTKMLEEHKADFAKEVGVEETS